MGTNQSENYEYFAFISYKREDEKFAKWLQNKLENYRFPTNLNGQTNLPKRIRPIFRDVTDLTPGILAEEIENALVKSKWLIIICSPRSAKSEWVCKEAQSFIDLGKVNYIIPFIIDGIPYSNDRKKECYPKALLDINSKYELLATNINEIGRNAATIKVIAKMFGLKFNTLWQRYEKLRKKRLTYIIIIAILSILLAIGTTLLYIDRNIAYQLLTNSNNKLFTAYTNLDSTSNCLEITNKKLNHSIKIIEYSNDSLNELNKRLTESNSLLSMERDRVRSQKDEILLQQMKLVTQIAESMFDEGRILPSYQKIKPYITSMINGNYPYSPEIASLLNKIRWHLAQNGYKIIDIAKNTFNVYHIKEDGNVEFTHDSIYVSTNLRYNPYVSEHGQYYLYDFHTSKETLLYEGRCDGCDFQLSDKYIYFGHYENMHLMDMTNLTIITNIYGEEVLKYRPLPKEIAKELKLEYAQSKNTQVDWLIEHNPRLLSNGYIRLSKDNTELLLGNELYSNRKIKANFGYENCIEITPKFELQKDEYKIEKINGSVFKICDEYLNQKLYLPQNDYGGDYLFKNKYGESIFFNPFIMYSMGNAVPVPNSGHILNSDNILCIASESEPVIYNLPSKSIKRLSSNNIDTWKNGHLGAYVAFSTLLDDRRTLCEVRFCGIITLYDIETGKIIDEYDLSFEGFIESVIKINNEMLLFTLTDKRQYIFKIPNKYESLKSDIKAIDSFWL